MRKLMVSISIAIILVAGLGWLIIKGTSRGGGEDAAIEAVAPSRSAKARAQLPRASVARTARGKGASGAQAEVGPTHSVEGTPLLSGKVLDSRDQPIAGARITVRFPDQGITGFEEILRARALGRPGGLVRDFLGQAVSGPDGRYAVAFASPLKQREYRVEARSSGFAPAEETWWYEGAPGVVDFQLDEGGETIEGTVVDLAGAPIAGAEVEAGPDSGDRGGPRRGGGQEGPVDRDATGPEGNFKLVVASGRYRVSARARGFAPASASGVEAGSRDLLIELEPARGLSGRVVDGGGSPLAGAAVAVFPDDERWNGPLRVRLFQDPAAHAETDEDGRFRLLDLSLGGYVLEVKKGGFEQALARGTFPPEGEPPPVEVRLKPGGILSGMVTDEKGESVMRALVVLREDDGDDNSRRRGSEGGGDRLARRGRGEERGGRAEERGSERGGERGGGRRGPEALSLFRADFVTETDSEGRFLFDTIGRSTYTLSVRSERHVPFVKDGLEVRESLEVPVTLDSGIILTGKVIDRVGEAPVPRAAIRVRLAGGDRREARSDEEGRYEVGGLTAGRLEEVQVRARGFSTFFAEDLGIRAELREQSYDFALERAASLSGIVLSTGGDPVPGARLRVASVQGETLPDLEEEGGRGRWNEMRRRRETERSGKSREDGSFRIEGVSAGAAFRMIVTHPDYQELRSEPFPVQAGAQVENLVYRLRAGGKLVAVLIQPDRTPAAGVRVEIRRQRDEPAGEERDRRRMMMMEMMERRGDSSTRTTSVEGKAVFAGLQGGLYTARVNASGFQPYRRDGLAVVEDQTAEVLVDLLPENIVSGVVVDSAGAPVGGARVWTSLIREDRGGPGAAFLAGGGAFFSGDARTGASSQPDGSFRVGSLGEGPYRLRASAQGFADRSIEPVEVNRPLEVRMERLGAIQGVVLVAEIGSAVPRFTVLLTREREGRGSAEGPTEVELRAAGEEGGRTAFLRGGRGFRGRRSQEFQDPGGAFALQDIEPGSYLLRVTAPDLSPREVPVRVSDGMVTNVRVLLFEGIVVSGLVVAKGTNEPLAGAEVMVLPAPEVQGATGSESQKGGIPRVSAGRSRDTGEAQGSGSGARGAGRRAGRPITDPTTTGEDGIFALRDLAPGKYILVVNHSDFVIAQENFEIQAEGLTRDLRINLSPGEELTGTVTNADASPAAGVTVSLRDTIGFQKRTVADRLGRYVVRGLLPGAHTFMVFGGGPPDRSSDPVEIKKGENRFDYRRPLR